MIKINPEQKLLDLKGEVIKEGTVEISIGLLIANTLGTTVSDSPLRSYQLARRFSEGKPVELKAEDEVFIKAQLLQSKLSPLYIGQVLEIFEK